MQNKQYHFAEFFYNKYITGPILPMLARTNITPNMITSINLILSFFTFYLAYKNEFMIVGFMMLVYEFFDNLDGNLARFKKLNSNLGEKLDKTSDFIFYNFIFIFIGYKTIEIKFIVIVVFLINIYGLVATKYILPRIRKLKKIHRFGIKKLFLNRGIILGMDVGTIDVICSIFLFAKKIKLMYIVLIILLTFDIFYRIIELKYNEKLHLINNKIE